MRPRAQRNAITLLIKKKSSLRLASNFIMQKRDRVPIIVSNIDRRSIVTILAFCTWCQSSLITYSNYCSKVILSNNTYGNDVLS